MADDRPVAPPDNRSWDGPHRLGSRSDPPSGSLQLDESFVQLVEGVDRTRFQVGADAFDHVMEILVRDFVARNRVGERGPTGGRRTMLGARF